MKKQLYWRGIPVPFVALWSSEVHDRIAPCKYADGRDALFSSGERGVGEPVWGKMEESRQRATCYLNRCQVCNCKLAGQRAFGMDAPQQMLFRGQFHPLLMEPPACIDCMRIALDICPGTRRRFEAGVLECFEIFESQAICQILRRVEEGGTESLNRLLEPGQTCVGMNKCLLIRFKRLTLDELRLSVQVRQIAS